MFRRGLKGVLYVLQVNLVDYCGKSVATKNILGRHLTIPRVITENPTRHIRS
jgi:hypothetical protein